MNVISANKYKKRKWHGVGGVINIRDNNNSNMNFPKASTSILMASSIPLTSAFTVTSLPPQLPSHFVSSFFTHTKYSSCNQKKIIASTTSLQNNTTTNTSTTDLNGCNSKVYMAITEGSGHANGEIGIAVIDMSSPTLILSQFSDGFGYPSTLTKINMYQPVQICIPNILLPMGYNSSTGTTTATTSFPMGVASNPNANATKSKVFCNRTHSKLLEYVTQTFPLIPIRAMSRIHFNNMDGISLINEICSSNANKEKLSKRYYALSAAAAILKYMEFLHSIKFAPKSLKLKYEYNYGCMLIDVETVHRLELLYSLCSNTERKSSIFGCLDNCLTAIGKRHLRAKILQPLCDSSEIRKTQECIKELIDNQKLIANFDNVLKEFRTVDSLLKIVFVSIEKDDNKLNEDILNLMLKYKNVLQFVPKLHEFLGQCKHQVFIDFRKDLQLPIYLYFIEQIELIICAESNIMYGRNNYFQRLYAVKANIHYFIDSSRNIYSILINELNDLVGKLSTEHNLPLQLGYTKMKGFHIQFKCNRNILPALPDSFKVINKLYNRFLITTDEIDNYNHRIKAVVDDIYRYSNVVIKELMMKLRDSINAIYILVSVIANMDIIISLAKTSSADNYCCPTFGDGIRITDAIHPLIEYNRSRKLCVPNNVIASPEYNFFIITGPNTGGKTIYIKMIAVLQIMAQIGCYVPAKTAQFRICDKLFSRIGFEDSIEHKASSFVVEIREMDYILKNITANSMVIIDELCRSTNPVEGEHLALKFCEKLLNIKGIINNGKWDMDNTDNELCVDTSIEFHKRSSPFIYLTTHYLELTKLSDVYFNAFNLHFEAIEAKDGSKTNESKFIFTHCLREGVTPIIGYGIALAGKYNFPKSVIQNAENIFNYLNQTKLPVHNKSHDQKNTTTGVLSNKKKLTSFINRTIIDGSSSIANVSTSVDGRIAHSHDLNNLDSNEIKKHFYDVYANIISIARKFQSSKITLNTELKAYLTEYIQEQNDELLNNLKSLQSERTLNKSDNICFELQKSVNNNNNNIADDEIANHSYHSILKRLDRLINPDNESVNSTTFLSIPATDVTTDQLIENKQQNQTNNNNIFELLKPISDQQHFHNMFNQNITADPDHQDSNSDNYTLTNPKQIEIIDTVRNISIQTQRDNTILSNTMDNIVDEEPEQHQLITYKDKRSPISFKYIGDLPIDSNTKHSSNLKNKSLNVTSFELPNDSSNVFLECITPYQSRRKCQQQDFAPEREYLSESENIISVESTNKMFPSIECKIEKDGNSTQFSFENIVENNKYSFFHQSSQHPTTQNVQQSNNIDENSNSNTLIGNNFSFLNNFNDATPEKDPHNENTQIFINNTNEYEQNTNNNDFFKSPSAGINQNYDKLYNNSPISIPQKKYKNEIHEHSMGRVSTSTKNFKNENSKFSFISVPTNDRFITMNENLGENSQILSNNSVKSSISKFFKQPLGTINGNKAANNTICHANEVYPAGGGTIMKNSNQNFKSGLSNFSIDNILSKYPKMKSNISDGQIKIEIENRKKNTLSIIQNNTTNSMNAATRKPSSTPFSDYPTINRNLINFSNNAQINQSRMFDQSDSFTSESNSGSTIQANRIDSSLNKLSVQQYERINDNNNNNNNDNNNSNMNGIDTTSVKSIFNTYRCKERQKMKIETIRKSVLHSNSSSIRHSRKFQQYNISNSNKSNLELLFKKTTNISSTSSTSAHSYKNITTIQEGWMNKTAGNTNYDIMNSRRCPKNFSHPLVSSLSLPISEMQPSSIYNRAFSKKSFPKRK